MELRGNARGGLRRPPLARGLPGLRRPATSRRWEPRREAADTNVGEQGTSYFGVFRTRISALTTFYPAEGLGYDYLLVYDHVLGAHPARKPRLTGPYTYEHPFHEPMVLFGFLSAVTTRLRRLRDLDGCCSAAGLRLSDSVDVSSASRVDHPATGRLQRRLHRRDLSATVKILNTQFVAGARRRFRLRGGALRSQASRPHRRILDPRPACARTVTRDTTVADHDGTDGRVDPR